MQLTIDIPDELFAQYVAQGKGDGKLEAEKRLKRFKDVPEDDRAIIFWGDQRRLLEAALQTTCDDFPKLYNAIKNLGSIKIGPIERIFTTSELIRLHDQAVFHNWTDENFIKLTVDEALDYIFNRL